MKTLNGYEIVDDYARTQIENTYNKEEVDAQIAELSGQIADLEENRTGSGVTEEMSSTLWAIMQKTAFAEALTEAGLTAFKTAWGIEGGGEVEPEEPDTPEVTLSSISATYSGGSVLVGTSVNSLTGIVVTATYSNGSTAKVTGYTLSGTIAEGSNTVTISYGGKSTTITVVGYAEDEPEVTLTSISASYAGDDVTVGTALTSLTGITVTGTYSDGTTSEITGYTLSGEIVEGSSTITVTYNGLTATFTVTGVAESDGGESIEPVYTLTETTYDKTTTTNSGYALHDVDKNWTIVSEISGNAGYQIPAWHCCSDTAHGIAFSSISAWGWRITDRCKTDFTPNTANILNITTGRLTNFKMVVTHTKGTESFKVYYISDSAVTTQESTTTYSDILGSTVTFEIGGASLVSKYFEGTVHDLKIYERVLSEMEINSYLGMTEPDNPEITLTSISASYTGGDVTVGTELTALTGITVTGTYSDGSTSAITGYTLSGEIAEGSNTITVTYNGLTTTFTVTGVAEEEEENLLDNALAVMEGKSLSAFYGGGFKLGDSETSTLYIVPIEAGTYRVALKVDGSAYIGQNNAYYMLAKLFKQYANLTATGTVTTGSATHIVGVSTGDYTGLNTSGYTNTDVHEVVSTSDITQEDNDSGERWLWIDFTYDRSGWIFVQKDTGYVLDVKVTKVVA